MHGLLLGVGCPGPGLKRVGRADRLLTDLLPAEAGGCGVTSDLGLGGSGHQAFLVLLRSQELLPLIYLPGLVLDILPVALVLIQLLK